jgi:Raf kinase inhibitor-like YbhB/YbcL family protein
MPDRPPIPYDFLPHVESFTVTSDDMADGQKLSEAQVYNGFGVSGGNVSPHLRWEGAPADTQSYVVTCYDPDAPTGSGFWHWVLYDIPADVTELPTGAGSGPMEGLPKGATHVRNDYGSKDFGGAAPPEGHGDHRYIFAVHALGTDHLDINSDVAPAIVGFMTTFNTLARAVMIPVYGR